MKSRLLRYSAIVMATAGLGLSAAAATSVDIGTTGPHSDNTVDVENKNDVDIRNENKVDVDNDNDQTAKTGDADVKWNTNGGSAETGSASNDQSTDTSVDIASVGLGDLCDCFGGSNHDVDVTIDTTGPGSDNHVDVTNRTNIDVTNKNHVDVDNDNDQYASSGDAKVSGNTNAGDAKTGDASNSSNTSTSISL